MKREVHRNKKFHLKKMLVFLW